MAGTLPLTFCFSSLLSFFLSLHLALSLPPSAPLSPNDYIVRDGEMAFEMYFIKKGSAHVVSSNGIMVVKLESGSYFGESALLARQPRMASVRAVEYCETCAIVKDDFDEILYEFPQERHVIIVAVGEELRRKKRFNSVDRNLSRKGSMKVRKMSAALRHSDLLPQPEEATLQDYFLPQGMFRAIWSLVSMFAFLYVVIVGPIRTCMSDLEPMPQWLYFVGESRSGAEQGNRAQICVACLATRASH